MGMLERADAELAKLRAQAEGAERLAEQRLGEVQVACAQAERGLAQRGTQLSEAQEQLAATKLEAARQVDAANSALEGSSRSYAGPHVSQTYTRTPDAAKSDDRTPMMALVVVVMPALVATKCSARGGAGGVDCSA
eukprot:COSAG01_NODE_3911_length_5548_cov_3.636998_4_plen_136_part_00